MPTIRIDDEVYAWLQSLAEPFEDNPNKVLRRVADLPSKRGSIGGRGSGPGRRRLSGRLLNDRWKVGAQHALYHREGTFYENLDRFPGALFDPNGYVLFRSESEYLKCPHLNIGEKLNVPGGISSLSGYVRVQGGEGANE